ncbi:hypothetical protein RclHR1_24840002 [Rhizophagus clarus]|uniref:RRM domain-containing protein n=1 Tax=Rhizophagus clarus TaxID=94130 RepID=A0A2Z6RSP8_9GLOM|nr:hypothetical protein RclHR1_24840002 [Rhizophagus clarus]
MTHQQALDNLLNTDFEINSKKVTFTKVISTYEQHHSDNTLLRDHTIQVHSAPLSFRANFIKKFFECYGNIEYCYAHQPNRNSPNRQIIYIIFSSVDAMENFTTIRQIWAYNKFLYVTPLTLDNAQQKEIFQFYKKLNDLSGNVNARDFQNFIEENNVINFCIS